jgi:Superfamily I DNA and RNA helicases
MSTLEILRAQILSQNPTEQQKAAIFADELEFLLRAAPGSGKTWTSCRRFIWRGANWPYSAGGLALLSFTNAAIREFQDATMKVGRRDLLSDPNYVGTFDAFLERFIIGPFGHLVVGSTKRPKLFTDAHAAVLKGGLFSCNIKFPKGKEFPVETRKLIPLLEGTQIALGFPSRNGGAPMKVSVPPGAKPITEFMKAGYYSQGQRKFWAAMLLRKRPHICRILARRFPEIIIDEAQDTNEWLIECLKELRLAGSRITLVGDPDQCIYEFGRASVGSLAALRNDWSINEKPLSQSFRCNNQIAAAVRNIGGNQDFVGCGDGNNEHHRPFIIRDTADGFAHSVSEFETALEHAAIAETSSAIICRAHQQLESIRGEVNYTKLKGMTKALAQASFFRDCRKDYKRAFLIVEEFVRSVVEDSAFWEKVDASSESEEARRVKLEIWRFVKSQSGLPAVSLSGSEWISRLRENLANLMAKLGINNVPNLNQKIKKTGLDDDQLNLPIFEVQALFPPIRQETIHQVKGESIDAVLVLGSTKFWNSVVDSVVSGKNSEDRRLAYVAMTRARHLLIVALPASHFDNHAEKWATWGFGVL